MENILYKIEFYKSQIFINWRIPVLLRNTQIIFIKLIFTFYFRYHIQNAYYKILQQGSKFYNATILYAKQLIL